MASPNSFESLFSKTAENKRHVISSFNYGLDKSLHQEGDETWIFSFTDLILNLLMFFVVMFAISSVDQTKLQQINNAISSTVTSAKKAIQKKDVEAASGNQEILKQMDLLVSQIDKSALQKNKEQFEKFQALQKQISSAHELHKLDVVIRPDKDAFDITFAGARLFNTANQIHADGQRLLQSVSRQLNATKDRLLITVESYAAPRQKQQDYLVSAKRGYEVLNQIHPQLSQQGHKVALAAFGSTDNATVAQSFQDRVVLRVHKLDPRNDRQIIREVQQ